MPDTPPQTAHHPATVGSTFMRQYYHLLAKEPESLHRFYKDESTWCHGVGSHMQDAISGQKAINDEILRRGYAGARVDLDIGSIDCQASLNGGVLVLVTGVMTLASSPLPKPFVQTFFLAVQPKGYFVLNDCLRFLELPAPTVEVAATATTTVVPPVIKTTSAPATPAQKAAIGTPVAASSSPAAKTPVKAATPVASPVKVASPKPVVASPVKKAASPVKVATPKPSETKPATPASPAAKTEPEPAAVKPPASPVKQQPAAPAKPAEPAAPAAPKTWAALFSSGAAAPAATPAPKAAPKPTPASPAAEAAAPAASAAPASQEKEKEKKRYSSIYIRDLPAQVKDSDLRELFKSYGEIANITVPAGRGFAFVDYYHEEHMRAVLADTKEFKLFDKVIQVDERSERNSKDRSGFRSDSRGGRGGRGAPKSGRGERKEREDGKERRPQESKEGGAAAANGKPSNGPRSSTPTDRREKGGRRSGGKEDAAGRGARAE